MTSQILKEQLKKFGKWTAIIGVVLLVGLNVFAAIVDRLYPVPAETLDLIEHAENWQRDAKRAGLTPAQFISLKPGMSYDDVVAVMRGAPGSLQGTSGRVSVWLWTDGQAAISVTFAGDELMSKSQRGLEPR